MKNRDFKDSRLLEAFDFIDQKYIAEVADSLKFEKAAPMPAKGFNRRTWRHIAALAACVLLLGAVIPMMSYLLRNFGDIASWFPEDTTEESNPLTEPETPPEETTTLPPETTEEETTAEETTSEETTAEETTDETTAEETTSEETTSPPETTECAHSVYTATENTPTCTESATVNYQCSSCGYSWSETFPPLGHNYVNNVCTRCGAEIEYDGSRGLEYKISDDGTYAILVGIGTCTDKDIVVASNYNGVPVKVIGERALFYEKADSIRVSDTVEIIEEEALGGGKYTSLYISASVRQLEGAFSTCDRLEKIEVDKNNPIYRSVNNCLINTQTKTLVLGCINSIIPADGSVTKIGNKAFETARFTNITIPEGITEIGKEAFAWCMMLESITIPDSVKIIGELAFTDCEKAKTLKLGKGVESIGNAAFYCCSLITEIELPQSLKYLGGSAFAHSRIKNLVIPDGVKFPEGAHNMFASYYYLESIVLPSGIESFGSWFFGGCKNLKSITIPSSVKVIGDYAFYGCRSLKEIIIPEGVTEIGEGAFKQCTGITSIVVPESVKSIGNTAFAGCTELVSITLPSSITEISASSFSECAKLRSINIPVGVTSIGNYAFRSCTSLESLTLPDSVKRIGEYAFNGCSALKDIDLGEGLESIETWAFENCTSLKQIEFPESMKEIVKYAFVRSGLESIRIPNGIKRINDSVFVACASLKDVSLPEGLTEIGYSAFSYCTSLETLVIPNTVTMIGGEVFENCTALKSLTIPPSVKVLQGSEHFRNCTSLVSMTIPEGITMQFEYYNMFDGCTSLTSVTLPRDLPRVSREIFKNCSALTEINYGGTVAQWNNLKKQDNWNSGCAATVVHCSDGTVELYASHSYDGSRGLQYKVNTDGKTASLVGIGACTDSEIVIASSYDGKPVTEIIESALADNAKITAVLIPNSVLKIGKSAFARCDALKSIEIPDSVKAVGSGAFYQCTALESVKFGSGITELGNDMFYKCSALESIVFGNNIKKIGAHSFCHCVKLNSVIVPDSVESIEMFAFEGCSSLTEMTLGKGIKAIGERALAADNLTEVSFKGTKENWNSIAFDEKWNLYSGITVIHCSDGDIKLYDEPEYDGSRGLEYEIRIDSFTGRQYAALIGIGTCTDSKIVTATYYQGYPVTDIDGYVFDKISGITSITVSEGVTYIEMCAFSNCPDLRELHLPSTLMYIGDAEANIISGSNNIEVITIPKNAEYFYVDGNCLIEKKTGTLALGCKTSVIPTGGSVKEIGRCAFQSNPNVKNIVLPEGITKIDELAFAGCKNLKSIVFPKSLTEIGPWAFQNCTSLEKVNLTEKVTVIYYEAFHNCTKLAEVVLPGSLEKIYWSSFGLCPALNEIKYLGTKAEWNSVDIDISWNTGSAITVIHCSDGDVNLRDHDGTQGLVYKFSADGKYAILVGSVSGTDKRIVVATTYNGVPVKKIGSRAFAGNASLTEIVIPEGVTVIENEAFYVCGLQKVTLPSTLEWIQDMAFARCSKLAQINIPDGVREIGQNAFKDCVNLTSLTLGAGIELIEEGAFENCTSIVSVSFPKNLVTTELFLGRRGAGEVVCTAPTQLKVYEYKKSLCSIKITQ